MSDLKGYIASRKRELEERRDHLQSELTPILTELAEIGRAERALSSARAPREVRPPRVAQPTDETIKGRALKALISAGRPLTANEIRESVSSDLGKPMERTTFSPQLSRLCAAGTVIRQGQTYSLAPTDAHDIAGAANV